MKRILITGAGSYIGTSFENYISENFSDDYTVDTVDMIDGSWREKDFSGYDAVFHVAGIAHIKETKENAHLYYEVNRDLAIETAKKAKKSGVKQFVFLSTMSVYGIIEGVISQESKENPKSNYGKSKLQAEKELKKLEDGEFKVTIIRPPMVYGDGCKGNYQALIRIAEISPLCPTHKNERSLISIENLCRFVKCVIDEACSGCFRPQNREYVCTSDLIWEIRLSMNKRVIRTSLLNPLIKVFAAVTSKGKKAFGNLKYVDLSESEKM